MIILYTLYINIYLNIVLWIIIWGVEIVCPEPRNDLADNLGFFDWPCWKYLFSPFIEISIEI
jgi:hypothetical protein